MALLYAAFAAINAFVLKQVNHLVTEPYMDEPFHVPQAQAYCAGNWTQWDSKITTPPGLYLYSIALQKLFLLKCSLPMLRFSCTLVLICLPPLLTRLLKLHQRLHPPSSVLEPTPDALILSAFPVLWFFGFLYYTELPSVATVLGAMLLSAHERHYHAALLGIIACSMRQTNIIWILYGYAYTRLTHFRFDHTSRLYDPMYTAARLMDVPRASLSLISAVPRLLPSFIPYALVLCIYSSLVFLNGGIPLGDKSNHSVTLHIPQFYYFYAFSALLGWPVLLGPKEGPIALIKTVFGRLFGNQRAIAATVLMTMAVTATVHFFTIHHPFLLADNRHYTFYVWRRVFRIHPIAPLLLSPGYVICIALWIARVEHDQTLLQVLALPTALLPVLLTTPLIEPRYFIIPYLFLRSQVTNISKSALIVEGLWYILINVFTMSVFLYAERPAAGRFMW